jgi:hypothetical protein
MSDTTTNGTQVNDEQEPSAGDFRKRMEAAQEEAQAAKAELAVLQREQAFTKAGIPDTGPGALVRKAYDGEADPDAIKAFAEEYGVGGQQGNEEGAAAGTPANEPQAAAAPDPAAAAAAQAVQAATAGGGAGAPANTSPVDQINAANSAEEVLALAGQAGILQPME